MSFERIHYEVKVMGWRVIWVPLLIVTALALLMIMVKSNPLVNVPRFFASGLEMLVPLATGIVVATTSTQDAATELQLTMPRRYYTTSLRRLGIIIGWTTLVAFVTSIILCAVGWLYLPDQLRTWTEPSQFMAWQLVWAAPLLWLVTFGLCLALLIRSRSASGALLGGLWLVELIAYGFFISKDWLHPLFLFPTTLAPYVDYWMTNRMELLGMALAFLIIDWLLLHNSEALLKNAQTGE